MKRWVAETLSKFNNPEQITYQSRRELTLRYILWSAIVLMLVLSGFRTFQWMHTPTGENSLYLANSLFGVLALLFTAQLNDHHHAKAASITFLVIAYFLCMLAYPIRNPDQVILYFALPTAAASFISEPKNSIRFAALSTIGFTIIYYIHFQGQVYPFFSLFCLFTIAIITNQVARIIQKMTEQLVATYDTTIEGWSQALEMRNQETEGHSHRVADLTMQLVKKMQIPDTHWDNIRRGVLLHDIGKMGVPDSILCKQGPLTKSEILVMRNHPQYAKELLSKIPYLVPALDIPYYHHEKWDGTGYPCGLIGHAIPLTSRIFTVIDVWDAMRSTRSYRPEIPEIQVIEYLRSESGRSFDPVVIKAFFEMMGFPLVVHGTMRNFGHNPQAQETKT